MNGPSIILHTHTHPHEKTESVLLLYLVSQLMAYFFSQCIIFLRFRAYYINSSHYFSSLKDATTIDTTTDVSIPYLSIKKSDARALPLQPPSSLTHRPRSSSSNQLSLSPFSGPSYYDTLPSCYSTPRLFCFLQRN